MEQRFGLIGVCRNRAAAQAQLYALEPFLQLHAKWLHCSCNGARRICLLDNACNYWTLYSEEHTGSRPPATSSVQRSRGRVPHSNLVPFRLAADAFAFGETVMDMHDALGQTLSGATTDSVLAFERAQHELRCYIADPVATIDKALAASPSMVMAHALKAYLHLLGTEP
ncbi:MAG TPA: hypothetical protein VFR86_16970, partial [Burkholderiaceae bacterium]|nr:hypothetical protein [Burkholderiaceae bacterium]